MRGKIKVNKKTGVGVGQPGEGKAVTLARDKNEIKVETDIAFSKRYNPVDKFQYYVGVLKRTGQIV